MLKSFLTAWKCISDTRWHYFSDQPWRTKDWKGSPHPKELTLDKWPKHLHLFFFAPCIRIPFLTYRVGLQIACHAVCRNLSSQFAIRPGISKLILLLKWKRENWDIKGSLRGFNWLWHVSAQDGCCATATLRGSHARGHRLIEFAQLLFASIKDLALKDCCGTSSGTLSPVVDSVLNRKNQQKSSKSTNKCGEVTRTPRIIKQTIKWLNGYKDVS